MTIRNYNDKGIYFESKEALLIGAFIVLRAMAAQELKALSSPSEQTYPFTIKNTDPQACSGYRSHTVAKVIRCNKSDNAARFEIGAQILFLSD